MRVTQDYDLRTDVDMARPGTSDALFARAIDATQRPVLVQAHEAVSAAVPRIVDSVPPSMVGLTMGFTVLVAMAASQRFRLKLSPVLMAGLLLLPVSNYQAQEPSDPPPAEAGVVEEEEEDEEDVESEWQDRRQRDEKPEPSSDDSRSFGDFSLPSIDFRIPRELIEEAEPLIEMVVPEDWSREDAKRFLRRNARKIRREIEQLRREQRIEARRHAYSTEHRHHHHSR